MIEDMYRAICLMSSVFIKAHRPGFYTSLKTQFRLNEYLHEIDLQAKEMVRAITDRLAHEQGVDEALKAQDGLRWVQEMNNCKAAAEEVVMKGLIYNDDLQNEIDRLSDAGADRDPRVVSE